MEHSERNFQGLWDEHFAWLHTGIFTVQALLPISTVPDGDRKGPCRNVDIGKGGPARSDSNAGEKVMFVRSQSRAANDSAWRNHTHNTAFHQALRLARILELLSNRHLEALL